MAKTVSTDAENRARAKKIMNAMRKLQQRQKDVAIISGLVTDGGGRALSATATVGGIPNQPVTIDAGSAIAVGEVWAVENMGSATAPSWRTVSRTQVASALPWTGDVVYPAPSGLDLESGFDTQPDGSMMAWIYASWLTILETFGQVRYEVQLRLNSDPGNVAHMHVQDISEPTTVSEDVSDAATVIPRAARGALDNVFAKYGRIKIGTELISYDAVTDEAGESGGSGTGGVNTFTVAGKAWTTDQWVNFALVDGTPATFLIVSNTADTLTVVGTTTSGTWEILPCFSGCTRGVNGTTPAAHVVGRRIYRRSCGAMWPSLPINTDYDLRVRAVGTSHAVGAWSAWASITTDLDTTAPPAPDGLAATPGSEKAILTWTSPTQAVVPDLKGFQIYRSSDDDGADAVLVMTVGAWLTAEVTADPGVLFYYNLKAFDTLGNLSDYGDTWVACTALYAVGVQLLVNSDFERDYDDDGRPDNWLRGGAATWTYGSYGIQDGMGMRAEIPDSTMNTRLGQYTWASLDSVPPRILVQEGDKFIFSFYFSTTEPEENWIFDPGETHSGKVSFGARAAIVNSTRDDVWVIDNDGIGVEVGRTPDGFVRVAFHRTITAEDLVHDGSTGTYIGFYASFDNATGHSVTIDIDRPQMEFGSLSQWQPNVVNPGGDTALYGLIIDSGGIKTADNALVIHDSGMIGSDLVPDVTGTRDLGTADNHWDHIYVDHMTSGDEDWNVSTLNFVLDGGGSAISTGVKGDVVCDFACEIQSVTMLADQSGSIVVDIWKDTYSNYPPTDDDSITSSTPPTISASNKSQDATLTGWTKMIAAGSILRFNVDSCSTITRCTVSIKLQRTVTA